MNIRKKLTAVFLMTSMVLSLGANGIFSSTIVKADMYSEYGVEYWDGTIETYMIGDVGGRVLDIGDEEIDTSGVYEVINRGEGRITVKANTKDVVLILNNASRITIAGTEDKMFSSPLQIEDNAEVTLVLLAGTSNEFICNGTMGNYNSRQAGIWVSDTGMLTIKAAAGDNRGKLEAYSGYYGAGNGAGIGGGGGLTSRGGVGGTIKISGDAVVTATASGRGAGIGGAGGGPNQLEASFTPGGGDGGNIEIYDNAKVTATSKDGGAGIGGGGSSANGSEGGSGGVIKIYGNAVVEAISELSGAGIGGGRSFATGEKAGAGGDIEIYGNAKVTATSDRGAGIGGGGSSIASAIGGDGGNIKIYGNPMVFANSTETDSMCMGAGASSNGMPGVEGTITITGGNVYAREVETVTNKSDGLGDPLVMIEAKNNVSNKSFSYEFESMVIGPYTYKATADGAKNVYIWAPTTFTLPNMIEIERDTDDKKYNDTDIVNINIYAEHGYIDGEVVGIQWVRVPISGDIIIGNETEFSNNVTGADSVNKKILSSLTPAEHVNVSIKAEKNARYWFKIDFRNGTKEVSEYVYIDIDNFYTPIEVYVQDIDGEDNDAVIKDYVKLEMPSDKPYGIPYDLDGSIIAIPSLTFDELDYIPNLDRPISHWNIDLPEEPFDSVALTIALDDDVFLETGADKVEGNKYYYTAKYTRNANWGEATANFVDATGKAIRINGAYTDKFLVPLDGTGLLTATDFLNNGGAYAPPKNNQNKDAQGWYILGSSHSVDISLAGINPNIYYRQTDFQDFDPEFSFMADKKTLENGEKLFIVYPTVEETTTGGGTVGVIKPTVPKEETVEPQLPAVSDKIKDVFETENHISYIKGYPDETVKPNNNITRGEVATIFWRLIISSDKNNVVSSTFSDVNEDEWYAQAVNYLASLKIITGYEDGTFKPNQSITRAEFIAIASRFDDLELGVSNPFVDVQGSHWAYTYILSAYEKGWVSGYEGSVFLPNSKITRAEVVKIVNGMLGRGIEKEDISKELYTLYPDLTVNHWAFAEIIEASVEHNYERKNNGYELHTNR